MYQVYYFTRTGNSERIARKIADGLSCDTYPIHDDVDWGGIKAFFKFQSYASGKKTLKYVSDGNHAAVDEIVVVSPIWGSRLPPTVQQFIAPYDKKRIHVVTSSLMDSLRGGDGFQSVTEIIRTKKNEDALIKALVHKLGKN